MRECFIGGWEKGELVVLRLDLFGLLQFLDFRWGLFDWRSRTLFHFRCRAVGCCVIAIAKGLFIGTLFGIGTASGLDQRGFSRLSSRVRL